MYIALYNPTMGLIKSFQHSLVPFLHLGPVTQTQESLFCYIGPTYILGDSLATTSLPKDAPTGNDGISAPLGGVVGGAMVGVLVIIVLVVVVVVVCRKKKKQPATTSKPALDSGTYTYPPSTFSTYLDESDYAVSTLDILTCTLCTFKFPLSVTFCKRVHVSILNKTCYH